MEEQQRNVVVESNGDLLSSGFPTTIGGVNCDKDRLQVSLSFSIFAL